MKMIRLIFVSVYLIIGLMSCEQTAILEKEAEHWEYEHVNWQNIGYLSCGGNNQSPVNINTGNTVLSENLPEFSYDYSDFNMKIVDNSHTIQVNPPLKNQILYYNDIKYSFAQLHFHHHSEHQLDQAHMDMELHIVHSDSIGNLLVLTLMIQEGATNDFWEKIFQNVPTQKKVEVQTSVSLNLNEIIPTDLSYYTYYGSLTTPPCTATVQFIVLKEPMYASRSQIDKFASFYIHNARPVQPLNNRLIFEKIIE
jgi:carbonic anhydrase